MESEVDRQKTDELISALYIAFEPSTSFVTSGPFQIGVSTSYNCQRLKGESKGLKIIQHYEHHV